jgi:hypothetical protein
LNLNEQEISKLRSLLEKYEDNLNKIRNSLKNDGKMISKHEYDSLQ